MLQLLFHSSLTPARRNQSGVDHLLRQFRCYRLSAPERIHSLLIRLCHTALMCTTIHLTCKQVLMR